VAHLAGWSHAAAPSRTTRCCRADRRRPRPDDRLSEDELVLDAFLFIIAARDHDESDRQRDLPAAARPGTG